MKEHLKYFSICTVFFCLITMITLADDLDFQYKLLDDGTVEITGITRVDSEDSIEITIPSVIAGCIVTAIGEKAFFSCEQLTSVTLPDRMISIGDSAFFQCKSLTNITIPSGITSIGKYAFTYCQSLKTMTIPDSVISIGKYAFRECDNLTDVFVGRDSYAKQYCIDNALPYSEIDGATTMEVPSTETSHFQYQLLENGTVEITGTDYLWEMTELEIPSTLDGYLVSSIGEYAFEWCDDLTDIVIPETVTSIAEGAFSNCGSLKSIAIPNSVTSIGSNPFTNCYALTSIRVSPDHPLLATISGVLYTKTDQCLVFFPPTYSVSEYTIPDGIARIGSKAFYHCEGMSSINIPNSVISIEDYAFECCMDLTSITISDSVTYIGDGAFDECYSLEEVIVGTDSYAKMYCIDRELPYTEIEANFSASNNQLYTANQDLPKANADDFQYSLLEDGTLAITGYLGEDTAFEIPSMFNGRSVTMIGEDAFRNQANLINIMIPDSVTSIGNCAFGFCYSLEKITIPDSVTSIGYDAFDDCSGLTSIIIPNSVISIDDFAFAGCENLTSIHLPESLTSIGTNPFLECTRLNRITVSAGNPSFTVIDGVLFDKTDRRLVCYPCAYTASEYTIPDGTAIIGDFAFYQGISLESITIPESITAIGRYAFSYCESLRSITIPRGVSAIKEMAFLDCQSLTSIVIPYGVSSIEGFALSGCKSLTSIVIPESVISIENYAFSGCESLTSIVVPDSVTSIEKYAFYGCSDLKSITIPDSVTFIGESALDKCYSLIEVVVGQYSYAKQYCMACDLPYTNSSAEGIQMEGSALGFESKISVSFTLDDELTITGLSVSAPNETEGIGKRVMEAEFIEQFHLRKFPVDPDSIEAVSGATYTSNAVIEAVNSASPALAENISGYTLEGSAQGFGGDVVVHMMLNNNMIITSLDVDAPNETVGLGKLVMESDFTNQFLGKSLNVQLSDIDAVAGATISTQAVIDAIAHAAITGVLSEVPSTELVKVGEKVYTADEIERLTQNYLEQQQEFYRQTYGINIDITDEALRTAVQDAVIESLRSENDNDDTTMEVENR